MEAKYYRLMQKHRRYRDDRGRNLCDAATIPKAMITAPENGKLQYLCYFFASLVGNEIKL